ncbi:MAG: phosphatidylserine decarboxylase [Gammaproteobacteria bacterium]|nr:phosphatidylserine decarboxylase [Gammaproteobacteria bacterium]
MLLDYLKVLPQYPLPHHGLSRLMHRLMRVRFAPVKDLLIRTVLQLYAIDMKAAQEPNPRAYPDFNSFFTRALHLEARPITDDTNIACPVDGMVSEIGGIDNDRIIQAKGHNFNLQELLGGNGKLAARFLNGSFATVYLSPRDYHRIHMPLAGTLRTMIHVPGRLFSVNSSTTRLVPNLFARNERVACIFDTGVGPVALIMVGAIFVGSIETVWAGEITPPHGRRIRTWNYAGADQSPVAFTHGQEMGRFNMGSTVILLFPEGATTWDPELRSGKIVRMGESMGKLSLES